MSETKRCHHGNEVYQSSETGLWYHPSGYVCGPDPEEVTRVVDELMAFSEEQGRILRESNEQWKARDDLPPVPDITHLLRQGLEDAVYNALLKRGPK